MKASTTSKIKTCYKRMINILFGLLPFKNKMIYIRTNYNGTIMILFEVIRFLFLMSLFALIASLGRFIDVKLKLPRPGVT